MMPKPAARRGLLLTLAVAASFLAMAADDLPSRLEAELPPHGTIRWEVGKTPVLRIEPARGDGWIS